MMPPQKNSHFYFHVTFALLCMASLALFYLQFKYGVIAGDAQDSSVYGLHQFDATYCNRVSVPRLYGSLKGL